MSLIIARIFIAANPADSIPVRQTSINSGRPREDLEFFHVHEATHPLLRGVAPGVERGDTARFRYADRFTTLKIVRRAGAVRRRVAPGQSRRSDRIGWPQWGWQIDLVCAAPR